MNYDLKNELNGTLKDYFSDIKKFTSLTKDEEHKLIIDYRINKNINARDKLITSNLKYASKMAASFRGRGVCYSDLISEANTGLIESIENFDLNKNVKLFSYAKWLMLQKIELAINKSNKMPEEELPTTEVEKDVIDDDNITVVPRVENANEKSFIDFMPDDEEIDNSTFINKIFEVLNGRESDMVNMYFGRGYEKEHTLEEIGDKYNLTKERVRQIIENTFRKIRSEAMLVESSYLSR